MLGQRGGSCLLEPIGRLVIQPRGGFVKRLADLVSEFFLVHSCMPRAFKARANACVAREQWVLTLPSEHPITAAVSATSISSQ